MLNFDCRLLPDFILDDNREYSPLDNSLKSETRSLKVGAMES